MLFDKRDFQIRREAFCLCQPWNVLRIICGAFFLPHALSKFADSGLNPNVVGFFSAAGFQPAEFWVVLAAAMELFAGVCLIAGIATRYTALMGAGVLVAAVGALYKVNDGFKWLWNTGGYEYVIFWAICCVLVAMQAFQSRKQIIR